MRTGRPIRFLAVVLGGWVGLRVFVLWPEGRPPRPFFRSAPAFAATAPAAAPMATLPTTAAILPQGTRQHAPAFTDFAEAGLLGRSTTMIVVNDGRSASLAPLDQTAQTSRATGQLVVERQDLAQPVIGRTDPSPSRWSASIWAIARPAGDGAGLGSSQLGGSQAGARVAYALGSARRVSLVGRIATPLKGRGREGAIGLEWRPFDAPVRMFAEQRIALDGGRGGPSLGVVGGVYRPLPLSFRLEGYGQAGVIKRDRVAGFADGALRVSRPIVELGGATIDLGAGAWGGAQRDAERLDVGPTLGVSGPVAGRTVRLTLDWRARVAGGARPGSGPALSLGADF